MDRLRSLLSALWRSPFSFERALLRRIAARYAFRWLALEPPAYAAGEDARAPAGILNRSGMIMLAFEFMNGNVMTGDYFEFGCWGGRTFRLAYEHHKAHFNNRMHFWLFDSFKGLPELVAVDEHPKWRTGDFCTSLEEFVGIAERAGIPSGVYSTIVGYYEQTLTPELAARIALKTKAGVVYVDCDLYESTRKVLDFIYPILQAGTVICFDDFYCFNGSPVRGEQLAIKEFLKDHGDVEFVEYVNFGWHGKSYIVHLAPSKSVRNT